MDFPDNPLVSIVIPVYNGMPYIREALESVLNQTYPNIEFIVLDDGSTDETKHFLKTYHKLPPKLVKNNSHSFYFESHPNIGQTATLNKGWQMCQGEIISYLSADDVLYPDAVSQAVSAFKNNPGTILTYSNTELINSQSKTLRKITNDPNWNYYSLIMNKYFLNAVGAFFLKTAFLAIGGWNEKYTFIADYEYYIRLAKLGKFTHIPYTLAKTRIHPQALSSSIISFSRAEESKLLAETLLAETADPQLLKNKNKILSQAYLLSSRAHWKSKRFKTGLNYFIRAIILSPSILVHFKTYKLILNALFK